MFFAFTNYFSKDQCIFLTYCPHIKGIFFPKLINSKSFFNYIRFRFGTSIFWRRIECNCSQTLQLSRNNEINWESNFLMKTENEETKINQSEIFFSSPKNIKRWWNNDKLNDSYMSPNIILKYFSNLEKYIY
jgi:hypothetical protein